MLVIMHFPVWVNYGLLQESMNVALKNIPNELSEYGTLSMRQRFWPESIVKRVSILKLKSFVAIIHFEMWKITSKSFAKEWLFKSLAVASSIGSARGSKKIFLSCPRRLINTFPCAQNSCFREAFSTYPGELRSIAFFACVKDSSFQVSRTAFCKKLFWTNQGRLFLKNLFPQTFFQDIFYNTYPSYLR